jgi:hypothetical protein
VRDSPRAIDLDVLVSQSNAAENLARVLSIGWMAILVGPTATGKTSLVRCGHTCGSERSGARPPLRYIDDVDSFNDDVGAGCLRRRRGTDWRSLR